MLLTTLQDGLHVQIQSNNTLLIKYYYNTTTSGLVLFDSKSKLTWSCGLSARMANSVVCDHNL